MTQKLMFLYLKTGGGHLSPARSVAQWIGKTHQENYKVDLVDGFEGVQPIVKLIVEDGYKKSQEKARWVFEGLYALNKIKPFARITTWIVSKFVVPALEKKIVLEKPDKIVIFHFFLIKPVNEILKRNQLNIPVLTVVTDPFTAHPIWFLEKDQNFIVFSEQLKIHLSTIKKIEPEKIHTFPFILNEKFSTRIVEEEKDALRLHHNIHPKAKVILIMGGADGIPKGERILKRLLESNVNANILMVCGWNSNLVRRANELKKQYQADNLQVFSYVTFVYELLSISDLVITKCGASTFMEVLMLGKIPIINSYIWEQEKGNVDFVCNNDLGKYEKKVKRIPSLVETILFGAIESSYFKSNIDKMGLVNGTPQVSEFILQYQ
jgi:UDP-N-acetylglucosamine:LPS N-acetylglucosamine transferase